MLTLPLSYLEIMDKYDLKNLEIGGSCLVEAADMPNRSILQYISKKLEMRFKTRAMITAENELKICIWRIK